MRRLGAVATVANWKALSFSSTCCCHVGMQAERG